MSFTGIAIVRFKKSVLEPQGQAIHLSLKERGETQVELVRVGRYIEVQLNVTSEAQAAEKMQNIAEDMLYNPVMETCEIKIEKR